MSVIDLSRYDERLLERARGIRMLVLDVDGVLTDGRLYFDSQGNEMKAFCTRDGLGIKTLQKAGIDIALITGRTSDIVRRRAEQLGISHLYQGRDDKLNAFHHLLQETGLEPVEVCYAGDDWIDIPVLDRVGLAVTVADADPVVKTRSHWITEQAGGRNAVREICDMILAAQGLDEQALRDILDR